MTKYYSKIEDIPRRKPSWYPDVSNGIGDTIHNHIMSRRVYPGRQRRKHPVETWAARTARGRAIVGTKLRKKFPWAFTDTGYWERYAKRYGEEALKKCRGF